MKHDRGQGPVARRSFLSRIVAGTGALGALFGASSMASAQSAPAASGPFQPARHAEDDWLDQPAAKHRFFYDTTSAAGYGQALFFARNYFVANASGYKLADADVAQVVCMRHESTSFAFNDAMWTKYGTALSERAGHFGGADEAHELAHARHPRHVGDQLIDGRGQLHRPRHEEGHPEEHLRHP